MIGIGLNVQNDLFLASDGSLGLVEDGTKVAQDLRTRLRTLQGEVVLDNKYGFPYGVITDGRSIALSEFELTIKQYILETNGVTELTEFSVGYISGTRKLAVSFSVNSQYSSSSISLNNIQIGSL